MLFCGIRESVAFLPNTSRDTLKILVAGVGNVLRGDDGFGVAVARTLRHCAFRDVNIFEAGIAGISLVQELMDGYDALIVADAIDRGGAPGTVYLIEPEIPRPPDPSNLHSSLADAHYTEPSEVLVLAKALGVLPRKVFIIGCQPHGYDELGADLSPPVKAAVGVAVTRIRALIESLQSGETS